MSQSPESEPRLAAHSPWYVYTKTSLAHEEVARTTAEVGRCTIGELVDETGYTDATIMPVVRTLNRAGILQPAGRKRVNQPGNPAIYHELTPEGSKLLLNHLISKGERIAQALDVLGISAENDEDLGQFRAGDSALYQNRYVTTVIQDETCLALTDGELQTASQIADKTGFRLVTTDIILRNLQRAGILDSDRPIEGTGRTAQYGYTYWGMELLAEDLVPRALRFAEAIQELRRVA